MSVPIWGVYQEGELWLGREHEIRPGEFRPTGNTMVFPSKERLVEALKRMGLSRSHKFAGKPGKPVHLKETWV
jgi:hypothetical protein